MQCSEKKVVTLTTFKWMNGCINDYIRAYLDERHIPLYNTLNGDVYGLLGGEYTKLYAEPLGKNYFAIKAVV